MASNAGLDLALYGRLRAAGVPHTEAIAAATTPAAPPPKPPPVLRAPTRRERVLGALQDLVEGNVPAPAPAEAPRLRPSTAPAVLRAATTGERVQGRVRDLIGALAGGVGTLTDAVGLSDFAGFEDAATNPEHVAMGMPDPPALQSLTGLVKGAPRGGFYSRVDDAVRLLPAKGAHPNKITSLLKSNASAEELAHRKVPEFLASHGNATVTPAQLRAHLAAHPAPVPTVKKLGGALPVEPRGNQWVVTYPDGSTRTLARQDEARAIAESGSEAPKYAQYQLPGGENYRETLLTLPEHGEEGFQRLLAQRDQVNADIEAFHRARGDDRFAAHPPELVEKYNRLQHQIDAMQGQQFRSGHFDDPNIVVHTRANERTLPVQGLRSIEELEPLIQRAVGARSPAAIASGAPSVAVRQGLISPEEAQLYGAAKGFHGFTAPTGARGRFIEEVQSDWHQAGKKRGYDVPGEQYIAFYRTPRGQEVPLGHGPTEAAARASIQPGWDAIPGVTIEVRTQPTPAPHGAVPDAPFKESWPDLGLKQQLLETAADPQASWLGFTSGATQADRYNLRKFVDRVYYDPQQQRLIAFGTESSGAQGTVLDEIVAPDKLADTIGKEAAKRLLEQPTQSKRFLGNATDVQVLEGANLEVGGEGMRHFYDQVLPKRLEKILKPFGGTVERGFVRTDNAPADVVARYANQPDHPFTQRQQAEAWIARLTPEMKARILKEGLPLLTLPLAALLGPAAAPAAPRAPEAR